MTTLATRADLFRTLTPGTVLTMTAHDWYPNTWMIGVPRVVTIQQTKRIALQTTRPDGETVDSWMTIPKASDVRINGDATLSGRLSPDDEGMTYRIGG